MTRKKSRAKTPIIVADPYVGVKILAVVACLVIALAVVIFLKTQDKGSGLDGVTTSTGSSSSEMQEIRMIVEGSYYSPSSFTVSAGKPVRWVIDASKMSGCTSAILFRDFGISRQLQRGENVIEFTPTKPGTYTFTCGMGMVRGTMTVV